MATSRTGTAQAKRWVAEVLRLGQRNGITHCPGYEGNNFRCGVELDYTKPRTKPNSAVADHIIPWSLGGPFTIENGIVRCYTCNSKRGNGTRERKANKAAAAQQKTTTTLVNW